MSVMRGVGLGAPLQVAGAPVAAVDNVQTVTIGGTPTGGTFNLSFRGMTTQEITWSSTNATLLTNIENALEALVNIDGVTLAAGTLTAGIGTLTVTFDGSEVGGQPHPVMTADATNLTGTSPTVGVAETTAGVEQTGVGAPVGAKLTDTTNGVAYINTGTPAAPTWTVIGAQT